VVTIRTAISVLRVVVVAVIVISVVSFEFSPLICLAVTKKGREQIVIEKGENNYNHNSNKNTNIYQTQEEEHEHIIAVLVVGGSGVRTMDSISSSSSSSHHLTGRKDKLVHSSFRIEENVIRDLANAAEKKGMTLSSLVNKTLKNYVTTEMYFEELGFILVSKNFLRKTFEGLDEKHVEELGKEYGMTIAKEYFSYFYPEVNSNTLIEFLDKIWFRRFQSCQHKVDDNNISNRHYFTVNHDINMNFSLALQSIVEALLEPVIKGTVEFKNITSNAITFSFEVS
jgi:hypothetical protein